MIRNRWRGWRHRGQVERVEVYTIWSLYGLIWAVPLLVLAQSGDVATGRPPAYVGLLAVALLLGAVGTVLLRASVRLYPRPGPLPGRLLAGFSAAVAVVVVAVLVAGLPDDVAASYAVCIAAVAAWSLGGYVDQRVGLAAAAAAAAVPFALTGDVALTVSCLVMAFFFAFTVRSSLWLMNIVTELDRARRDQGALAVAEERLRFSRDVHDVLGRQLSAIAVKAELAASLATRADPGAAEQMLEVRSVAHDALREARELARGYRPVDLQQELHGARALLRSAGISCTTEVAALPAGWHEPAAWIVREAVTNVLRHSRATRVAVTFADGRLTVRNDGAQGAVDPAGGRAGLSGLAERLTPLGAGLSVEAAGDDFCLVAELPGDGPVAVAAPPAVAPGGGR